MQSGYANNMDAPATDFPEPLAVSAGATGMVTWTKVKVLDEDRYISRKTVRARVVEYERFKMQSASGDPTSVSATAKYLTEGPARATIECIVRDVNFFLYGYSHD